MKWSQLKEGDVVIIAGENRRRKVYTYTCNNEYKGRLYLSENMFDNLRGNFLLKMSPDLNFHKVGVYLSNQGTPINV